MSKKLKAYRVREDHEGHCVVVFATGGAAARREGANELNLEFEEVESCTRAREFDQFADKGFVPAEALIDAGWWMSCHGCERQVSGDDDDEHGKFNPVYTDRYVWCTPECREAEEAERKSQQEKVDRAISQCREKFPFGTDFYCNPHAWKSQRDTPFVSFNFPGGQGRAEWEVGDDMVSILQCDLAAWRVLRPEPTENAA